MLTLCYRDVIQCSTCKLQNISEGCRDERLSVTRAFFAGSETENRNTRV